MRISPAMRSPRQKLPLLSRKLVTRVLLPGEVVAWCARRRGLSAGGHEVVTVLIGSSCAVGVAVYADAELSTLAFVTSMSLVIGVALAAAALLTGLTGTWYVLTDKRAIAVSMLAGRPMAVECGKRGVVSFGWNMEGQRCGPVMAMVTAGYGRGVTEESLTMMVSAKDAMALRTSMAALRGDEAPAPSLMREIQLLDPYKLT